MKLEEYIKLRLEGLKQFKEDWMVNNIKDPANWPEEMSEGEWYEQERLSQDGEE